MAKSLDLHRSLTPNQHDRLIKKGVTRLLILKEVQGVPGAVIEYTRKGKKASFQVQADEMSASVIYEHVMKNIEANESGKEIRTPKV